MKKRSVFSVGLYVLIPFLLLFAACSGGNSGGGSEPMASVGITLKQAESTQSKPVRFAVKTETITSLEITARSENGNELARNRVLVEPGGTVTLTLNVPVGANRIFTAEAFDDEGQVILFGEAVTDLQEGVPVLLTIPVEAPLQIAPENPTIDLAQPQIFTATRSPLLSDVLQWSVDGTIGGDVALGVITETGDTTAEYIAPTTMPASGQVTVRVSSADEPTLYFHETTALLNDPAKTLFVDPVNGVDSDDCGAETTPCRTLTKALSLVESGGTVLVLPGTYTFGSGTGDETLPLQMKAGVTIHGTTQGGMAALDFPAPDPSVPGILGADDATLSGFQMTTRFDFGNLIETNGTSPNIQDNLFFGSCDFFTDACSSTAIFVDQDSAPIISGNTFGAVPGPNSFFNAIRVEGEASPQIINNDFTGNLVALLIQGDATSRIENNRILGNREGLVVEENAFPDLGGGISNSAGLNVLSCNTFVDLFNNTSNTISAQENQWDHELPTEFTSPGGGVDIVGDVDSDNATLYPFATCNFGIQVSTPSPNFTTESGGTATFDVVLGTQPSADVVIAMSSSDPTEGIVSNNSLTFTPQNWNTRQPVIVTGVDDAVADGPVSYQIDFDLSGSLDLSYQDESPTPVDLFNTDDETPGITVSPISGLTTTEAKGTATFNVVLTSEPTATVSIPLSSSDPSEGTISTDVLSFDALDWNVPQTVTVTGVDDAVVDGTVSYTIVTGAASGGAYAGVNPPDVSVSNTDDDVVGITVTPTSGLVTTEAGGPATFDVVLTSEPTALVSIALSSGDTSEGSISTGGLGFDASNWNIPQTVTVMGVNDDVDDGDTGYTIVTVAATSTDTNYNGINPDDVSVTNTDDDTTGVSVIPTSGLITTESSGSATFTMALTSEPTANVTIALSSDNTNEGTVSPTILTFTSTNWNAARTVTVTGVDDFVIDGDIAYTIESAAAMSSDGNYSGFNASDVDVVNRDNDSANIIVNPMSGLETTEAGGTDTFTVVLGSQPTANVTVGLSSSDTGEGTVLPVSLTFMPSNWNSTQTVTVTGVNDGIADGDEPYNVITAAATSNDTDYNGLNPSDVSVTNLDNNFRMTADVVGGGSLTLQSGTIPCGTSCIADFPSGTQVTLRVAIDSGWTFDSWSGDCSGTSSPTTVTMDADKNCTANMRRTLLLNVDFEQDDAQNPPNLNPPGDPTGDRLTLDESAGTVLVQRVVFGNGTLQYAVLNQVANQTGGLNLSALVAGTAPRQGRYIVQWRSAAEQRNLSFASMVVRDSSSRILMNISYRPGGVLDLNDQNPNGIGIGWTGPFQLFEVTVNLDTQSIDDIVIDGKPIQQTFPIPFRDTNASDLSRLSLEAGGTSAQTLSLDDLVITLLQ